MKTLLQKSKLRAFTNVLFFFLSVAANFLASQQDTNHRFCLGHQTKQRISDRMFRLSGQA